MRMTAKSCLAGAVAAVFLACPALADRAPTLEERSEIESQLVHLGFTSWDEIEWDDDGYWEVDDALHSDGREYDLHLAPDTLEVIKQEAD